MEQTCCPESDRQGKTLIDQWEIFRKDKEIDQEILEISDDDWEFTTFVVFQPEEYKIAYSEKIPRNKDEIERIITNHLKLSGEAMVLGSGMSLIAKCSKCGLKMIEMGGKYTCFHCGTI